MVSDFHGGEIRERIEYDFSVNINPLGMPDYVKESIIKSIDALDTYPDRSCTELKKCISAHEGVSADEVLCGNGASELIMAIAAFLSKEKDIEALVEAPSFSGYERAVRAYGGNVHYYKNIHELIKQMECSDNRASVIFICNPNNPTGEIAGREELIRIVKSAQTKNVMIVIDECFIDFTHEKSMSGFIDDFDNLIILKAFTKYYAMAGVRLGYILSTNSICEGISKYLPEWNVSVAAQAAGISAIRDFNQASFWKEKTLLLVDTEREYLECELKKLVEEVLPSKANFILFKSERKKLWDELRTRGILVRNCSNFKGLDDSYIRVCVSTHENNEKLISALKELI